MVSVVPSIQGGGGSAGRMIVTESYVLLPIVGSQH